MAKGPPKKTSGDLTSEDRRIWARVSGSVTPPTARKAARITPGGPLPADPPASLSMATTPAKRPVTGKASSKPAPLASPAPHPAPRGAPEELEPRRQRRLSRERDPIEDRIDLHGFGRFEAEDQLRAFLMGCQARGLKSVLVITGQGRRGGGIIRASVHEWLQSPGLRPVVSGFASAHRRHGGDGAIYVTLRKS
ncbi:MAG: DNA mismatch repair protein MutS [Caulobacteraceae bacterium]|nr:DNA mismatch repair protein MutS [Caulobacteraceae bacterium]